MRHDPQLQNHHSTAGAAEWRNSRTRPVYALQRIGICAAWRFTAVVIRPRLGKKVASTTRQQWMANNPQRSKACSNCSDKEDHQSETRGNCGACVELPPRCGRSTRGCSLCAAQTVMQRGARTLRRGGAALEMRGDCLLHVLATELQLRAITRLRRVMPVTAIHLQYK